MSKQIYVQAQADHIESLFRSSPLAAVEELVWNALDANAREVRVDLVTNPLGAVDAVRVADDGTGIDARRADQFFGNLGGSWKRTYRGSGADTRLLHGRNGRGRFKAFALGNEVEWRTTTRIGDELLSYRLSGSADRPGVFELEDAPTGSAPGTEVCITNVRATVDSLLDAGETVQDLAARFALHLKSYPDIRIYFNGLPVTPVIVQKRTTGYKLTLEGGATAKLEVIEWKRKFVGSGRLVFADPGGFRLHEQPAGVRSGVGASFTAYLVSPRFPALAAENALVMDELNPEVRQYLDAARRVLKSHFLAMEAGEEKSAFEREWEERIAALTKEERKSLLAIVKRMLKAK
ncbi:MAG: ATP-binding protein [Kiritimatiellae bacterium]|nr:ATP-binding protein [Kiritimatiellia bacterium]